MKKRLSWFLSGLFVVLVVVAIVAHNMAKPRIMILHSYGTDYAWTRDVNVGIRRVLHDDGNYVLRWHYMDLKRHPWPDAKVAAGIQARHAIDEWRPDVLIAIDDDAQEYVAKHYVNKPGMRIVFAGTNGSVAPYGYDKAGNVTGILERKPLAALKEALLQPGFSTKPALRIVEICDRSETVRLDHQFIANFDWKPLRYTGAHLVDTYDEWKRVIVAAETEADVILSTNYRRLMRSATDRTLVPPQEVLAWTEANSKLPVVGVNAFFVEDGGMLAIATSPFEQGEVAARMARHLIDGDAPASSMAIESTRQYVVVMNAERMAAHHVSLPPLYEAFARATNNYSGSHELEPTLAAHKQNMLSFK